MHKIADDFTIEGVPGIFSVVCHATPNGKPARTYSAIHYPIPGLSQPGQFNVHASLVILPKGETADRPLKPVEVDQLKKRVIHEYVEAVYTTMAFVQVGDTYYFCKDESFLCQRDGRTSAILNTSCHQMSANPSCLLRLTRERLSSQPVDGIDPDELTMTYPCGAETPLAAIASINQFKGEARPFHYDI